MIRSALTLPLIFAAFPVAAQCLAPQETFLYCKAQPEDVTIAVCVDDDTAALVFDHPDPASDMMLEQSIIDVHLKPSKNKPGKIWEELTFLSLIHI